jgi:hypothetical protein
MALGRVSDGWIGSIRTPGRQSRKKWQTGRSVKTREKVVARPTKASSSMRRTRLNALLTLASTLVATMTTRDGVHQATLEL